MKNCNFFFLTTAFILSLCLYQQVSCTESTEEIKWDPDEMLVIPDDGATYYLDDSTLNIEDITEDVIVEGTLEIRASIRIILNPKTTFFNYGTILVKNGSSFCIDGSNLGEEETEEIEGEAKQEGFLAWVQGIIYSFFDVFAGPTRAKPAFYSTGKIIANYGRMSLGGTVNCNQIFTIGG